MISLEIRESKDFGRMARSGKGNKAIRKKIYKFKKFSNIKIYSKTTITQKQTKRERKGKQKQKQNKKEEEKRNRFHSE